MSRLRRLYPLLFITLLAWLGSAHAEPPVLGSAAPDFKLQDQRGAWHELKSQRGKWVVLYFYPRDQLPSSADVATDFIRSLDAFREAGANVIGISVDDVPSHKKFADRFKDKNGLPFPVLADPTKQTTRAYGVLKNYPGSLELAARDTFLIDTEGRVVKHYTDFDPKGHAEVVLAEMKQLQKNPG